jgi:hypothetical protein
MLRPSHTLCKIFFSFSSEVIILLFFIFLKLFQTLTPVGRNILQILHIFNFQCARISESSTERNVMGWWFDDRSFLSVPCPSLLQWEGSCLLEQVFSGLSRFSLDINYRPLTPAGTAKLHILYRVTRSLYHSQTGMAHNPKFTCWIINFDILNLVSGLLYWKDCV